MQLSSRKAYSVACLMAIAPLGVALLSQYGFGTHPCDLCIVQRYPYAVAAMVAALAALFMPQRIALRVSAWGVIILSFLTTGAVACYHFAVEKGWVKGPESCSVSDAPAATLDALKAQILGAPLVSCADVGASFAGLSMAGWNALYGIGAALCLTWLAYRSVCNNRKDTTI